MPVLYHYHLMDMIMDSQHRPLTLWFITLYRAYSHDFIMHHWWTIEIELIILFERYQIIVKNVVISKLPMKAAYLLKKMRFNTQKVFVTCIWLVLSTVLIWGSSLRMVNSMIPKFIDTSSDIITNSDRVWKKGTESTLLKVK